MFRLLFCGGLRSFADVIREETTLLFSELKKHIQSGDLYPAYLVTGEDSFLVTSAVRMFRALAGPMADFNLSELTSPESARDIIEACESLPLGEGRKVVTVSEFKGDCSPVASYLDKPNPSTVLVFITEKPDNNLSKLLAKIAVVECTKLERRTVLSWIAVNTKELGSSITEAAANLLVDYCALDMSRISTELAKLCSYRPEGVINEEDVVDMIVPTLDYKIFALSEAVALRQPKKVAMVLSNLLDSGVSVMSLMGMLYANFRRLLYVSITPQYDRMASDLGVKEYAVRKSKEQASHFTAKKLKKICDNLQQADYDIKSGRMNDRTALELAVLEALTV